MNVMTEDFMKKSEALAKHTGLKKKYKKYFTYILTFL